MLITGILNVILVLRSWLASQRLLNTIERFPDSVGKVSKSRGVITLHNLMKFQVL